jgi:branched-subunit amino acid transport protein
MTWLAVGLLAAGSYGLKVVGVFALDGWLEQRLRPLTSLLPAALFAALVVVQTFGDGRSLVVDARFPGVLAGAIAVWYRAPFVVVVIVAMAVTACTRALTGT